MFVLHKAYGATPLQTLDVFRARESQYATTKLGYAGRLDPLAEGVLLVLEGEENLDPAPWRALDKQYDVSVLFGFGTDSDDLLGLLMAHHDDDCDRGIVERSFDQFRGTIDQRLPSFSSPKVRGRRLYAWARDGGGGEVPSVQRECTVRSLTNRGWTTVSRDELRDGVNRAVSSVHGDFRQDAIAERWLVAMAESRRSHWHVVHLSVHCSSGTYMRALARDLGDASGTPAIAWRIVRTAVGPYTLADARV